MDGLSTELRGTIKHRQTIKASSKTKVIAWGLSSLGKSDRKLDKCGGFIMFFGSEKLTRDF